MKSLILSLVTLGVCVAYSGEVLAASPKVNVDYRVLGPGGQVVLYFFDQTSGSVVLRNCGNDYSIIERREDCVGAEKSFSQDEFKRLARHAFLNIVGKIKLEPISEFDLESYRKPTRDNSVEEQQKINDLELLLLRIEYYIDNGAGDFARQAKQSARDEIEETRALMVLSVNYQNAENLVNKLIEELLTKYIIPTEFFKVADGKDGNTAQFNVLYYIFTELEGA